MGAIRELVTLDCREQSSNHIWRRVGTPTGTGERRQSSRSMVAKISVVRWAVPTRLALVPGRAMGYRGGLQLLLTFSLQKRHGMGIYDRDYIRDEPSNSPLANWSAVSMIIAANVIVFVLELASQNRLVDDLGLQGDLFHHPLQFWQLLTYGFVHAPQSIAHILFNMFFLWMFGRDVEIVYGKVEFLRIYIAFVIMTGLAWLVLEPIVPHEGIPVLIGASGAVMAIMAIYICLYPHRQFLLFFVIPAPAWVLGLVTIGADFLGFISPSDNVAHIAHLAGAAFGYLYFKTGISLASIVPRHLPAWFGKRRGGQRGKFRIHREEPDDENPYHPPVDAEKRASTSCSRRSAAREKPASRARSAASWKKPAGACAGESEDRASDALGRCQKRRDAASTINDPAASGDW